MTKNQSNQVQAGENVVMQMDGDILTIRVDTSKRLRLSSSGKSMIVASTGGNAAIGAVFVGLNVFAYVKPKGNNTAPRAAASQASSANLFGVNPADIKG